MNAETQKLSRKGSKHAQPELRIKQILDAAVHCFTLHGYHQTKIDTIAAKAELSKGSVYRFFDSKEDLLLSLIEHVFQEGLNKVNEALSKHPAYADKLYVFCTTFIDDAIELNALVPVWLETLHMKPVQALVKTIFQRELVLLETLIAEGVKAGELRPEALEAGPYPLATVLEGLQSMSYIGGLSDEECRIQLENCWKVIKAFYIK